MRQTKGRRHSFAYVCVLLLSGSVLASCGAADIESASGSVDSTSSSPTFEPTPTFIVGTMTPAVPSTPVSAPTDVPYTYDEDAPISVVIESDPVAEEDSLEAVLMQSALVVEGIVAEILPARWTTPDGIRPAHAQGTVPETYSIVTPIILRLTGEPIVKLTGEPIGSDYVVLMQAGGFVSDGSVEVNDPSNYFALNQHVVVAINAGHWRYTSGTGNFPTERGPGWWVSHQWTITDDGTATSYWSTRPLVELIAGFREAADSLAS